ncbi:MAG: alpha/beta fold hydrolase [bacterium]
MRSTHFLPIQGGEGGQALAVDWWEPDGEAARGTAAFVHGFGSNRRGDKALFFAERFTRNGWNFLSLDMRGHGDSGGTMEGLTLTRCLADLGLALDWVPAGAGAPVLIGSSMGAAVAAWYSLFNPGRVAANVMIAPALAFPAGLAGRLSAAEMEQWKKRGKLRWESEWLDVQIGYGLLEDGERYDLERLVAGYNVRTLIFHGMLDDSVDWRASQDFALRCPAPGIDLVLLKAGDHRLTDHKAFLFATLWGWLAQPATG